MPLQTLTPYDFSKFLKRNLTHTLEAYPGTPLFQNIYSQVKSGNLKKIVTTTHSYSITKIPLGKFIDLNFQRRFYLGNSTSAYLTNTP